MILKNFFVHTRSVRFIKIGLVLSIILPLVSCSGDDDDDLVGNWVKLSDFNGVPRTSATGVAVGTLGYMGTGLDSNDDRLTDFWTYDADRDQWSQIADFPGAARTNAVSFAADDKLYVGTGFDGTVKVRLKDFYEYDPSSNAWTQIADLQSDNVNSPDVVGREGAVAFTLNDVGYVGCGTDGDGNILKDFYAYDPSTQAWAEKTAIGGSKRTDAVAFVISDEAYVATGINNGTYVSDFWKYNATDDSWTKLRSITDATDDDFDDDYDDIVRNNGVAFTSGGKGYVATGGKNSSGAVVWEYNPSTDLWVEKTGFEGSSRYNAVAFTINDMGYVTTGQNSSYYFDDIWRFDPNAEQDDDDNGN
ncbi:galactose oxidase-like protein [Mangrovibacterium diazotrophicum]|uniref:Galactose oxidase-like protein n=1 Tax=Mangrovibacterium diazotrophicum TaxID=1261403 RepID=A0A419W3T1_9BACT|nr:galactose oxidase-like protein [Mangrovibacterium diazotrophicum]